MKRFERGKDVWVVVRDEWGDAVDAEVYMFFAEVNGYVIACVYLYDAETWEETVEYMLEQQREWDDPQFYVFPLEDCYMTRAEAEMAV